MNRKHYWTDIPQMTGRSGHRGGRIEPPETTGKRESDVFRPRPTLAYAQSASLPPETDILLQSVGFRTQFCRWNMTRLLPNFHRDRWCSSCRARQGAGRPLPTASRRLNMCRFFSRRNTKFSFRIFSPASSQVSSPYPSRRSIATTRYFRHIPCSHARWRATNIC